MEQNRTPIAEHDIQETIAKMKRRGTYPDYVYVLVEDDMRLGFTREETRIYSDRFTDIRQLRVGSNCFRNGLDREIIEYICNKDYDATMMETLYQIAIEGATLETLKDYMEKADGKAHQIKKLYESTKTKEQEKMKDESNIEDIKEPDTLKEEKSEVIKEEVSTQEATQPNQQEATDEPSDTKKGPFTGLPSDMVPGYLKELVDSFKEATTKLNEQEDKYEKLNEKLESYEKNKDDIAIRERMEREMEEKDSLLAKQQDELQQANSAIARLRREKENMEQEMRTMKNRMQDEIDDLNRKLKNQSTVSERESQDANHSTAQPSATTVAGSANQSVSQPIPQTAPQQKIPAGMPQVGIPIYYQMPLIDSSGQIVQRVQVERTEKKTGGVAGLLGKFGFAKKSRADIVKLVASGDLNPAQLVQIKVAIEKGLTEGQLVELINNNVSAEKMKEIIEIAVLENSMN